MVSLGSYQVTALDTTEKEGLDRRSIELPGVQEDLIKAIASQTSTPIIVVLVAGGPLAIEWLASSPRVKTILHAWYPGQRGGPAIADALLGKFSPAGRLPVTFYHANYTSQVRSRWLAIGHMGGCTCVDQATVERV